MHNVFSTKNKKNKRPAASTVFEINRMIKYVNFNQDLLLSSSDFSDLNYWNFPLYVPHNRQSLFFNLLSQSINYCVLKNNYGLKRHQNFFQKRWITNFKKCDVHQCVLNPMSDLEPYVLYCTYFVLSYNGEPRSRFWGELVCRPPPPGIPV